MIIPPPFMPIKLVKKSTPEYEALELHAAFFMKQGRPTEMEQSQAIDDYYEHIMSDILTSNTSQFGQLRADPTIEGSSDDGRLTLPNVRAAIRQVINEVDEEYLGGVKKVYVVHPTSLESDATRMMAALPAEGTSGHIKLISADKLGETKVFLVETFPMKMHRPPFNSTGWIAILFNPDRPVVQILVPAEEQAAVLAPLYGFGDTRTLEQQTMTTISSRLAESTIPVEEVIQEPNGDTTFPDFEATIAGEEWSIEVTRVLEGIAKGRVIGIGSPQQTCMTISASQAPPIGPTELDRAVAYAIAEKSAKATECRPGNKYCLTLVNVADLNIASDQYDWGKHDLSNFDAVVLLQIRPGPIAEVTSIKGSLLPERRL